MSTVFGGIRQLAFVVEDIDQAMAYWAHGLGIGPFFIRRNLRFSGFRYRGSEAPSPEISIALANSGPLQIELISQHDDRESIYRETLVHGGGFHHVSSWLPPAQFDAKRAGLLAQGREIAQEGTLAGLDARLIYWATRNDPHGFFFEMADLLNPAHQDRLAAIAHAAEAWDGGPHVIEGTA